MVMEGRASEVVAQHLACGRMGILPIDCYVRTILTLEDLGIAVSVRTRSSPQLHSPACA